MKYVRRVLQPDETIVYTSRLHWLIYLPAFFVLLVALGFLVVSAKVQPGEFEYVLKGVAAVMSALAVVSWLRALVRQLTTELAVTDRRIIYKTGLLARHTIEMNRSKVQSIDVDQSIFGRLFGYGTIVVRGTGGSLEPVRMISRPIAFRSHITAV
jgi:uncharacterized membrane protein YdbT with pleckstrin-like domain